MKSHGSKDGVRAEQGQTCGAAQRVLAKETAHGWSTCRTWLDISGQISGSHMNARWTRQPLHLHPRKAEIGQSELARERYWQALGFIERPCQRIRWMRDQGWLSLSTSGLHTHIYASRYTHRCRPYKHRNGEKTWEPKNKPLYTHGHWCPKISKQFQRTNKFFSANDVGTTGCVWKNKAEP